jgi:N-acetylneuraminate synthase/N,N'-diacetyllegionaminate synthase
VTGSPEVVVEGRAIGEGRPCFVIAEVGVNHNGDPALAARLVEAAAQAGVDAVKFQTFRADDFVGEGAGTYEYESQGRTVREPMLDMFRRLELDRGAHAALFALARAKGLVPLSTPADADAVDLLDGLGVGAFKVGSDDLVHVALLEHVASKGKPVILSTGMATEADVDRAVAIVRGAGAPDVVLLHCVSEYPAPDESVNLRKLATLRERYRAPVGFSDHSLGIVAAVGAVALGACVVEKHFTLDHGLPGPDHRFSADPAEMAALVRDVRRVQRALGTAELVPTPAEREMAAIAHRSIVAARDLPRGHRLQAGDLAYKRPGTGLAPHERERVLGRSTREFVAAGTMLRLDMLD